MGHKMKITEKIHHLETGEIIENERELSVQELAEYKEAEAAKQTKAKADAIKAAAKAALFEKLGITEDEAKLLLS